MARERAYEGMVEEKDRRMDIARKKTEVAGEGGGRDSNGG